MRRVPRIRCAYCQGRGWRSGWMKRIRCSVCKGYGCWYLDRGEKLTPLEASLRGLKGDDDAE
jgi:DnaJ-class molecular chaperone